MARSLAHYLSQLDGLYRDRPYFVGVKARLLAAFTLVLIVVFPINLVRLCVQQPPNFELRLVGNSVLEIVSLLSLRLIFRGRLEWAGSGLATALLAPAHAMIFFVEFTGSYAQPLAAGIQMIAFDSVVLLMAIVFASSRVAIALLVVVAICHLYHFSGLLHRLSIPGSPEFTANALVYNGDAAVCLVFILAFALRRMMEATHRRSEDALRQSRAVNENLEQIVSERTRELVRLNEEKNAFMGMAAHDLRNPAVKIRMITEMMDAEGDFSEARVRAELATIAETATGQLGLLNNLLDVNAIEEGRGSVFPVPLDARAMLRGVHADFRDRAAAKGLELVLVAPPAGAAEGLRVLADTAALRQVLDNLVSNALKFSPAGKRVWLSAQPVPAGRVRFAVRDEGPGLSAADRVKLFGKFNRLSAQPTGGETSNGLGLSIVKRLVEAMAGTIGVDSAPGQGATFRADFPAA
jgi:signal transduction histidine kinase